MAATRRSFSSTLLALSNRSFIRPVRGQCRLMAQSAVTEDLKHTALYEFHKSHGGKMVPFAGWSMPVLYTDLSIINSCLHTRQCSSIFDVSHMLQMSVTGSDSEKFLEYILVADLANLKIGYATLSMFTTYNGGIIDDCIVTRTGENNFYVVSNAGRADVDLHHMKTQLNEYKNGSADVTITPLLDRALVALQGPQSASVLQEGIKGDLSQLKFMNSSLMDVYGVSDCRVSRCGYTGEDGFEISVPAGGAVELTEKLLKSEQGNVKLAGLGARDILRLEAGLCLYGNDISEETTPIEAGLAWCISKRRRSEGGFIGAERILKQIKEKPSIKRVGLELSGSGPPARQDCEVMNNGDVIGNITSGSPSPMLQTNIAMAYVPFKLSKIGTEFSIKVRKHTVSARVVKMPFVPSKYYH